MQKSDHHAYYDTEGNIIIPGSSAVTESAPTWNIEEEVPQEETSPISSSQNDIRKGISTIRTNIRSARILTIGLTQNILREGKRQYQWSFKEWKVGMQKLPQEFIRGTKEFWIFLKQPVWVPGRRREPREYSRGTLFLLDVVRFGGTFAGIFLVLFVTLNYQSFWEITKSRLDPLGSLAQEQNKTKELEKTLREKLRQTPSLAIAGQGEENLLAFLPPVGPPDNRLIIPKLELNVPISIPPNDSLLQEDWGKLEEDIQNALTEGVVHYPGTARPGQAGNFFITGHSSYYPWAPGDYKSVFARLPQLSVGDEYWVYYGGDKHRYIIKEKNEVRPTNVSVLDQPLDRRIGTLMTCTPVGTTLHRLILVAQEVDINTGEPIDIGKHSETPESLPNIKTEILPI